MKWCIESLISHFLTSSVIFYEDLRDESKIDISADGDILEFLDWVETGIIQINC